LADYCVYCGLIGHRKFFFLKELFAHTLRGYVYPVSRIAPTRPASSQALTSSSSQLGSETLGNVYHTYPASSHGDLGSSMFLLESAQPMKGVTSSAFSDIAPSPVAGGFHDPYLATSHQLNHDQCPKGKAKISSSSSHAEPDLDSRSRGVSDQLIPPGFGPTTYGLPTLAMGPSISGPILHGATTQHCHSCHLQLAQQLTGVMGHSSSGLTLFGPSTLHFYQGTSSTGLLLLPPETFFPWPSSFLKLPS
jgi:hypothetical protein